MVLQQIGPSFSTAPSTDIELGLSMEIQYTDDTDFVSTSHNFVEDVMNVLDTEHPQYNLVCNTDKTQRVHVSREGQVWQKNSIYSWCSWGRARCALLEATSQFSISPQSKRICTNCTNVCLHMHTAACTSPTPTLCTCMHIMPYMFLLCCRLFHCYMQRSMASMWTHWL